MTDYSFMKTGANNNNNNNNNNINNRFEENIDSFEENLMVLLSLFSSNAMDNAANHVEICERNGITKLDVEYGLKYEVFEFLNRNNIEVEIDAIKNEIYEEDDGDSDWEDIDDNLIIDERELDKFKRVELSKIDYKHRIFIEKYYKYYDNWESWIPETPIQNILKNSIDKIS